MQPYENASPAEKIPKMIETGFEIYRQQPELRAALQAVRLYLTDQDYISQSRRIFTEFVRDNLCHIAPPRDKDKVSYIAVTTFLSMMNNTMHDSPELVKDPALMNELILMFRKYLEIN